LALANIVAAHHQPEYEGGRAACEFARLPSHISRKSIAKTSLISGSITRLPNREQNHGATFGSPTIIASETATNGATQNRRLDEENRQSEHGRDVGDEGRGHQPLADELAVQPGLDEDGVDDGEACRREREPADRQGGGSVAAFG
jgi:hypothetical protein